MRQVDLVIRELATIVDMNELTMVTEGMEYDEVESLCRNVISRLGREKGRWVLTRLAYRLRTRSPQLSKRVLRHAGVGAAWGMG